MQFCGGWLKSCRTGQCHNRVSLSSDSSWQRKREAAMVFFKVHWTANKKIFKPTIPIISFLMIYGLPTEQGYATLHAFRCIISASWDLIKITASKIPVKWKFTEDNTLYPHAQCFQSSPGKTGVNSPFYDHRQKFTRFVFFWHLGCFFYYMSWDHSLPGRKEKRKIESETCCRKCTWHYYLTLS